MVGITVTTRGFTIIAISNNSLLSYHSYLYFYNPYYYLSIFYIHPHLL